MWTQTCFIAFCFASSLSISSLASISVPFSNCCFTGKIHYRWWVGRQTDRQADKGRHRDE